MKKNFKQSGAKKPKIFKQKFSLAIFIIFLILLCCLFLYFAQRNFWENKKDVLPDTQPASQETAGLANPASTNCQQQGGQSVIKNKPDGSQYGLCFFDDARACEEWAMLRGDCPVGGVKTTGYDTDAEKFCAWSGGKTLAVKNAVCTFNDASTCLADDFYSGTCQPGDNPNADYEVEKNLDTACAQDSDCQTPSEYLVQSRCPFTTKCLNQHCAVVCPKF